MNSLSRTQKTRAGFTLLEVMVVIVILGVLASLVVPNLLGNKEKADRQKAISDIVALETHWICTDWITGVIRPQNRGLRR
ncbi:general secretion pathway protein G precursor (epsG-like) [Escherichia coli]|uniref:General secretion pathway protein G (EpsG-like) n=1 Tax=Escherichia coli TaxID=562 RepID=A0A376RCV4_ECOLX|nr:general secretion pathway protein G precursor (epsG-like) [Escherichia coli]